MQNKTWYIVQAEPQRESVLANGLRLRGYDPYWPIVWRTVRKRRGVMHDVRRPLFPGYLFVQTDDFEAIRCVPGCWNFLCIEGNPASLPEEAIEFVRLLEAKIEADRQAAILRRSCKAHDFKRGQIVRITAGPLENFAGRIERLDGASQLRLLLEMFGRPTPVVVKAHEIEAA